IRAMQTSPKTLQRVSGFGLVVALTIVSLCPPARAGHAIVGRKHAPIEVVRDFNGDAMRTLDNQAQSTNWSGYVLPKFETKQHYTSAQATWVVPAVKSQGIESFSSSWLGIGGYCKNAKCRHADRTLIQLGTEQDSAADGSTQYYSWYEMLPAFSIPTTLAVNPGDTMTVSLNCAGKCRGKQSWTLAMTDETTGGTWSKTFTYRASKLSVEWIQEAPTISGRIAPLADFGTAVFSKSIANGASANLNSGDSVIMLNANGQTSNVSTPDSTLDGFSACWGSGGILTSCFPTS
ncbi:MAG: G1 family glutamic endopeptidase, partial [Stellaceae bacterium]